LVALIVERGGGASEKKKEGEKILDNPRAPFNFLNYSHARIAALEPNKEKGEDTPKKKKTDGRYDHLHGVTVNVLSISRSCRQPTLGEEEEGREGRPDSGKERGEKKRDGEDLQDHRDQCELPSWHTQWHLIFLFGNSTGSCEEEGEGGIPKREEKEKKEGRGKVAPGQRRQHRPGRDNFMVMSKFYNDVSTMLGDHQCG